MDDLISKTHTTLTVGTLLAVLAGVAVALRFVARRLIKSEYSADDWWITASVVMSWIGGALLVWGLRSLDDSEAQEIDRADPNFDYTTHTVYLKSMYITSVLYYSIAAPIKISILCLYRRLFSVQPFKHYVLLVMLAVALWWFAATIADILSCIPAELFWDPSRDGRCFNFNVFWLTMGVLETIIDIIILILPIKIIIGLQMSRMNRVVLSGIFSLGGFVIITGILRVAYAYAPGSMNVAFTGAELWSAVHVSTGIICACLPTYRPLLAKVASTATTFGQRYHIKYKTWQSRDGSGPVHFHSFGASGTGLSELPSSLPPRLEKTRVWHDFRAKAPQGLGTDRAAHIRIATCEACSSQDLNTDLEDANPSSIDLSNKIIVRSTVDMV